MDLLPTLAEIFVIFLLAGIVKGVVGLGLPTVAIGLLGLMMLPAQAVAVLVLPSLVTNVWQSAAGPDLRGLVRRLWPMLVGICFGTMVSIGIITGSSSATASAGLGIALVTYAVLGLSKVRFSIPPRAESWLAPLVGISTGVVGGATGIMTLPAVPYLHALGLERDNLVQSLGLSFTVSTVALGAALAGSDALHLAEVGLSGVALIGALIGMVLGQCVRGRIQPERFLLVFLIGLLLLGAHLALRGFY